MVSNFAAERSIDKGTDDAVIPASRPVASAFVTNLGSSLAVAMSIAGAIGPAPPITDEGREDMHS